MRKRNLHPWPKREVFLRSAVLFAQLTVVQDAEPHPAAVNMAIDEVLLRSAEAPLLRFYTWAQPSVSFGYFGDGEEVRRQWPEREPVRRWTGGGVVLHGEDFTYSLIVPRSHPVAGWSAAEAYGRIHRAVAEALGSGACLAVGERPKVSAACFENPVTSDVLVDARKAAGAAQRRTREGMLHQGSVMVGKEAGFGRRLVDRLAERVTVRRLLTVELAAGAELAARKYATLEWFYGGQRPAAARSTGGVA